MNILNYIPYWVYCPLTVCRFGLKLTLKALLIASFFDDTGWGGSLYRLHIAAHFLQVAS